MASSENEAPVEVVTAGGCKVLVTHPSEPYFAQQARHTKLDVVQYYLAVAKKKKKKEGALLGIRNRPLVLKRFVNGAHAPPHSIKSARRRSSLPGCAR